MAIVLSLDVGTSKLAAVAFDTDLRKNRAVLSVPNPATVSGLSGDRHEQSPELIVQAGCELLRRLVESKEVPSQAVDAIAISGQMHGVLLTDRNLQLRSNLITWCDRRAADYVKSLDRATWPVERTGCYLHAGYGGATLAMLQRGGGFASGVWALPVASYVAARLCGTVAIDASHAASWGLLDVRNRCWDRAVVERLGLPWEILPEIRPCLSELGPLTIDIGLPAAVPVRLPLGDNQASYIGACGWGKESLLLNLGTGGQISAPLPEFAFYPELETRPLPFGGYLLVGASLCGGRSYAILKEFFSQTVDAFTGRSMRDDELYAVMDRLAGATDRELLVDTRLAGTRQAPDVRGSIAGIGVDSFTPAALCRGFTRGMIAELAGMVGRGMSERFRTVTVSGNAVWKNPLARPFVVEAFGLPCVESGNREEAATGAALAAFQAARLSGRAAIARKTGNRGSFNRETS